MRLACSSGQVNASVGDRFIDRALEWEIVAFKNIRKNNDGAPDVILKCHGKMPSWYEGYMNDDGTIDFCGDTVAAIMLSGQDGLPRSARGDILTRARQA